MFALRSRSSFPSRKFWFTNKNTITKDGELSLPVPFIIDIVRLPEECSKYMNFNIVENEHEKENKNVEKFYLTNT